MAIRSFTPEEVSTFDFSIQGSKGTYPWRTTKVGGGFFVPRTDVKSEDYRPTAPEGLKREGWKFVTSKFTCPDTKEIGIFVKRVA